MPGAEAQAFQAVFAVHMAPIGNRPATLEVRVGFE
jgi:hypothetical protein